MVKMIEIRRIPRVAALLAVLAVFGAPSLAAGRITIRTNAEVAGASILVGDIADITGVPDIEQNRIASLSIGVSPPPNTDFKFNAAQIKGRLFNAGISSDNFSLVIPDRIVVHRKATIVTGKQLVDAGIEFLKKNIPIQAGSITVEAKSYPLDIVLPYGEVKLEFEMENRPRKYGVQNFLGKVFLNGDLKRTMTLTSYLRVIADVAAAAKDFDAKHVLVEDDIKLEKVDIANLKPGAYNSAKDIIGKQTIRALRRGDIITRSAVADVPDINSGDEVSLLVRGDGFEISAKGKAMQNGYIGEPIRVIMDSSRKIIDGIVIDSKTVELTGK